MDADWDNILRNNMREQGWTEAQIEAQGSLRQFDKTPYPELAPDPSLSEVGQRRAWGFNLRNEYQARIDATRAIHAARTEKEKKKD
jgi:hypothetical protein